MAQVEYIKDLYEKEGKSLREISRITGHCFQTVQKYAYREDWSEEKLPDVEPGSYPVLGEYIPIIDGWLEEDRKIPRKQRHTKWRIYCRLCQEHGYTGSYSSVKRYVKKKAQVMKEEREGYLPLSQSQGKGQVDFGEHLYKDEKGREKKGYALTVSFPYSNMGYTQTFPSQNQECLLTGLQRIFEHIKGVPEKLRFDNMRTVVTRILPDGEREITEGFRRFMLHYGFEAEFCNPGSGHEKGHVENKVGYSRRNYFVPIPCIASFEEYNNGLWERCEKDAERKHYRQGETIRELWEEERTHLLRLPEYPFPIYRYESAVVNKCGFVSIETNRYGLSPVLNGTTVQAKIYYDHVEFYSERKLVGNYPRQYGRNEEVLDWTQYVDVLCRKPGAAPHTRFFRQIPERWRKHLEEVNGKERKNALELLSEIVREGNAPLCDDALLLAYENGRMDADSIRQCYYMIARKEYRPAPLQLEQAPALRYEPDLHAYDYLTGGHANA